VVAAGDGGERRSEVQVKVFDTVLFGSGPQDLDVLECRLREMGDCGIYAHVVVEGTVTFQGEPKPLWCQEHAARFARWADRIRYVPILPSVAFPGKQPGDAWAREHYSRNAVMGGLFDAEPDDLIIHGDVDEILRAGAVRELVDLATSPMLDNGPCKLELRHFAFAVDWEMPGRWHAPSVVKFGQVKDFTDVRESDWPVVRFASPDPAGWHLSSLGGPEAIRTKIRSFSHAEVVPHYTDEVCWRSWERGEFWDAGTGRTVQLMPVDVDGSWPGWVAGRRCPQSWFRPRES
jgi:beta-1,4-mannosyl-glycoprotein beta-1,4-N-acetylglucosaminyltransferase